MCVRASGRQHMYIEKNIFKVIFNVERYPHFCLLYSGMLQNEFLVLFQTIVGF